MPIPEHDRGDTVTVACWNVEHNGHDHGGEDHRRHHAYDVLAAYQPSIVLRQELTHAHRDGQAHLFQEANRLGLLAFLAPGTPESDNPTGVFIDPQLFEPLAHFQHVTGTWHPICNPVVRLRGAVRPLSLASFHLCSHDPATRSSEAKRLTVLGAPGRSAILGGDTNSYPHRLADESVPLPQWDQVTDASHYEHRTVEREGRRVSDTQPDEILAGGKHVFVDTGHYAATTLAQPHALAATASLHRTDQGGPQRIDRLYCTPDLAPALLSVEAMADAAVREASDHALIIARFSLFGLRRALSPPPAAGGSP
ncbi:endonuclease/exonuclease/phosphatase family protein [Streptacidiphilus sp. EB103A]|uniref:endonuclease/exonuclease/phosphatase family protein n=1 Tax=Streptacidiphilus sp. EB103A TaxID=3156275 RepID=UPI0035195E50